MAYYNGTASEVGCPIRTKKIFRKRLCSRGLLILCLIQLIIKIGWKNNRSTIQHCVAITIVKKLILRNAIDNAIKFYFDEKFSLRGTLMRPITNKNFIELIHEG